MKKAIALVLTVILCISLFTACGEKIDLSQRPDDSGSSGNSNTQPDNSVSNDDDSNTLHAELDKSDNNSNDQNDLTNDLTGAPTTDDGQDSSDESQLRGVVLGQTYTNEFAGISVTLDDDWIYLSDSEIQDIYGLAESMSNMDLSSTATIYDMYASRSDSSATLNINLENIDISIGVSLDEDEYLSLAAEQLETVFESAGAPINVMEYRTVQTKGSSFPGIYLEAAYPNTYIYELFAVKKIDNYMAIITVAALSQEDAAAIMSNVFISE